jgi:hypothetical protein
MVKVQDMLVDELAEVFDVITDFAVFSGLGEMFVEGEGRRILWLMSRGVTTTGFVGAASSARAEEAKGYYST